jgi:NodT family efflux transporter outer membrane factor (OMF) lipoprotein
MKIKSNFVGLFILIGLGGCTVGPDYQKPVLNIPDKWQASSDKSASLKLIAPETMENWWKSFGDAQLNQLMDQALTGNLDIKIALARIDQARAERRGARAELFPTVNVKAGAQHQENPMPGFAPGIRYNLFELGFDALWEIDLFGRLQRQLEAASADLEGASEAYRQSLVTMTAELARSYVEYRSLQNQLRITRSNLNTQQHTLDLTEKRFREGVIARHEVVRARALAETTMSQLPAIEARMIGSLRQLEVLVGRNPGSLSTNLNALGVVPLAPGTEILASPAATIRNRPDIQVAERHLAAATALQGSATAELFPKISISAFLGLRNTDVETLFKSAAFSYGTAANLLQPLLNFGRIRAGIDLANARQQEAYLAYEKAVLEALQETETALTRYLSEAVLQQMLTRSATDLRESVRLSQLRYQEGVISFLDVLDAQRSLYVGEIELARSEAEASTNLISVYKALGGGSNFIPPPQLSQRE